MDKLAAIIIGESYRKMKTNFPSTQHHCWEKQPLDPINLEYAAVDGFVAYDLYRRIKLMMKGLRHLQPKLQMKAEYCPSCVSKIQEAKRSRNKPLVWDDPDEAWKAGGANDGGANDGWKKEGGWNVDESSGNRW